MAIEHARSGDAIEIVPAGRPVRDWESATLVRDEHIEVLRMVLPAGRRTPEHQAAGPLTIQCLAGRVRLEAHGRSATLEVGSLVFLRDAEAHVVEALTDSALLLTLWLHRR